MCAWEPVEKQPSGATLRTVSSAISRPRFPARRLAPPASPRWPSATGPRARTRDVQLQLLSRSQPGKGGDVRDRVIRRGQMARFAPAAGPPRPAGAATPCGSASIASQAGAMQEPPELAQHGADDLEMQTGCCTASCPVNVSGCRWPDLLLRYERIARPIRTPSARLRGRRWRESAVR